MEDPDLETLLGTTTSTHDQVTSLLLGPNYNKNKQHKAEEEEEEESSSSSWDQLIIRAWRKGFSVVPISLYGGASPAAKNIRPDLMRLLLGVLGCPLAPIPLLLDDDCSSSSFLHRPDLHGIPIEASSAYYIIQQYLAATGCLKVEENSMKKKNMYAAGSLKMVCYETEIATRKSVKRVGNRIGDNGCFVLWQMSPGMWSIELVIAGGNKVVAGSNGKIVWRHTPWLGTHAAKGPRRPLRRIIQGLDPKSTANLFAKAQCLGEKRIGDEDCFVLKVASDRADVMERSEGAAEVIRHVLYGYFSQKSGLLIYLEDSHLTRVQTSAETNTTVVYWETTIGTSMGDYRDVDGVLISHQGRSVATLFRFGEASTMTNMKNSRTRMEEVWRIDDVMYNVPGLSVDYFIPPSDIFNAAHSP
ncbi:Protein of unknown function DUF620 [Macleaya cordata]|uniref:Uncharacterized protein n=1 Tax=Macleaya cordata TaxID=56857 RepID=A0A200QQR2_MACCD|nr:Protein of unknown function DUF620 [Macleaya cordata]